MTTQRSSGLLPLLLVFVVQGLAVAALQWRHAEVNRTARTVPLDVELIWIGHDVGGSFASLNLVAQWGPPVAKSSPKEHPGSVSGIFAPVRTRADATENAPVDSTWRLVAVAPTDSLPPLEADQIALNGWYGERQFSTEPFRYYLTNEERSLFEERLLIPPDVTDSVRTHWQSPPAVAEVKIAKGRAIAVVSMRLADR